MGCLGLVLVGLLALAAPASIAPASVVGAYVVIGLLAIGVAAAVVARARRRPTAEGARTVWAQLVLVAIGAAAYAAIVTAIHAAA